MKTQKWKLNFRPAITGGLILFFSVLVCVIFSFSVDKKQSIIIAVYDGQAASNHIVHLRKISFVAGVTSAQENIMEVVTQQSGDRVPRIRFDLGPNQIYRNRWVITSYGNVIDLVQRKILVDSHDKFVRASGDSIVFYTNDIMRGKFYSVLNLSTGVYAQVKSLTFNANTGHDVEPDCTSRNFKIYYYPPSAEKVELVKDAGYGEDITLIPQTKPSCPIFWIDNDNFLYPYYSSDHNYVSVMKVNFISKTQEKMGGIDRLPENHSLSRFYKNKENEIVFVCARGHFKIDTEKKEVKELQFLSAGYGFFVALNETDKKGREIRKDEQAIGNYYCAPELSTTSNGYIAFPYEIVLGSEHYLQGAAVFSDATKKWKTIGDSDLSAVIGWIEE
ncbi:hypothetical protein BH09BAC5_BH09BAC5_22730 [soil metagenome]